MARTKLEIDKAAFQKVVNDLEAAQSFENPSLLWKAVEATAWAKGLQPRPLTAAIAYTRAKELGIVYKAKPGKKGRVAGFSRPAGPRVPRAEKLKKFSESFVRMRLETPERWHNLIDRAENGSKTAAIKLNCLNCSCFEPKEVKLCPCINCPLYPIRPYQGKEEDDGEDETPEVEVESTDS